MLNSFFILNSKFLKFCRLEEEKTFFASVLLNSKVCVLTRKNSFAASLLVIRTFDLLARERTELLDVFHWSAKFIKSKSFEVDGFHFIIITWDKQHFQLIFYFWLLLTALLLQSPFIERPNFQQRRSCGPKGWDLNSFFWTQEKSELMNPFFWTQKIASELIKNNLFVVEFNFHIWFLYSFLNSKNLHLGKKLQPFLLNSKDCVLAGENFVFGYIFLNSKQHWKQNASNRQVASL